MSPKRVPSEKPSDEKQTKISSFFLNGPSSSSKLFSTISQKSSPALFANKRALLSTHGKSSKAVSRSGQFHDDDRDVILVDTPDRILNVKESLLSVKDSIKARGSVRGDALNVERKEVQDTRVDSHSHGCGVKGSAVQDKNPSVQISVKKLSSQFDEQQTSDSFGTKSDMVPKHIIHHQSGATSLQNVHDHALCLTPLKSFPDETETCEGVSPDIVFDTPSVNVKKFSFLNNDLMNSLTAKDGIEEMPRNLLPQDGSDHQQDSFDKFPCRGGRLGYEGKEHCMKGDLQGIMGKLSGVWHQTALQENSKDPEMLLLGSNMEDFEMTSNSPVKEKSEKEISSVTIGLPIDSSSPCRPRNDLTEFELDKPFQPTVLKQYHGPEAKTMKIYRTMSGSKLLDALQQAEVNAQERETRQKMNEKIVQGLNESNLATVVLPSICDDFERTGSSLFSPKTNSRKKTYGHCTVPQGSHHKAVHGSVDFSWREGSLAVCEKVNEGQLDSKEDFTTSAPTETSHKKGRKSLSKFIADCNLPSDAPSKVGQGEVTLRDDPIFQRLMDKLRPSKPDKENAHSYQKFSPNDSGILKPIKLKLASNCDRDPQDNLDLSTEAVSDKNLSALPLLDPFSLQKEDSHISLVSSSTNTIHVGPPETKQQENLNTEDVLVITDSPDSELATCSHAKTTEDVLVITDSPDSELTTCSRAKSRHSLETMCESGRMKRKLSETDSKFAPTVKRAVDTENSIVLVGENNDLYCNTKMDCDLVNSTLDLSDAASAKTKVLPEYETQASMPKFYNDLISSSTFQDASTKSLKSVSSKESSATSLPSSPNLMQAVLCHEKQNQSTGSLLSDIKTPTLIDNDHFKQMSKGYVDLPADKMQDGIPGENPENQNSDTGTLDFDDTFDLQDNSLLLAAAADVPISVADGDKSDFRFVDLWQRFVVKSVSEDHRKGEKYLGLKLDGHAMLSHHCVLKGFWTETRVREGDVVNVLAPFENDQCIISDTSGFLVINPDSLMSGTAVVSSVFCMRKSVLNEIVKGQDARNIHMLYGTFLHSLFQIVLKKRITDRAEIVAAAKTILSSSKFLHEMYSHSVSEAKVWEEMDVYIPAIISWVSRHTQPSAMTRTGKATDDIVVTDIQDIEENIWSPRLGLKGKIDVTVKVKSGQGRNERTLPLEVKTGKASFSAEHKGQVILYSMMYGDRREDPREGILLYLKHSEMEIVTVKPQSQSGLIQLRNSMSSVLSHVVEQTQSEDGSLSFKLGPLPEPINNQRSCSKCPHLTTCCMYQRSVEKISHSDGHAMKQLALETLAHLDDEDLAYFKHWTLCLLLEHHKSNKTKLKEIWTLSSKEREKRGDCLCNLVIVSSELGIQETQGFTEGQGCSLTFVRHQSYTEGSSLDIVGLNANDSVVVSSEDGRLIALATGFIRNISSTHVEVVVDRDNLHDTSSYRGLKFRLDRNDSFSTHGTLLANVSRLMEPTSHAAKMRRLIIKKMPPSFEMKIPMIWVKKIKPIFKELNKPQKSAILKVLMAKDFVLIRGFPGSGKTTAIVALVKVLNILGMSLLITSYTHSAVDNIALKLKQDGLPFLRLGRQSRIHPQILSHSAEILTMRLKSVQELSDFYASHNIVATSCLGMTHSLFTKKRFDVCIVDEASQVLQPACLGPLFNCDKFVLVGDGQQLPPLVQSEHARLLGMDESLFTRLEGSGATYDLNLQYRMNETIMDLSNFLVYEGKLKCGSPDVASRCLAIDSSTLKSCPTWLSQALSCDIKKCVTFIDTGQTCDAQVSKGCCNETEANVVMMLLEHLVKTNVQSQDIGVISPYRSQVKLLLQKKTSNQELADVEINTVDQYQGRDKRLIIVSFVYSCNKMGGELLKDKRRLNVALTRAQSKLILVGNAGALQSIDHHLGLLVSHLEKSHNIIHFCETESANKV